MARASVVRKAGITRAPSGADADPLFSALDGRRVGASHSGNPGRAANDAWIVQVTGIHRSGEAVFVQIAGMTGGSGRSGGRAVEGDLVLRMTSRVTAAQALAALEARHRLPDWQRPHVVDVMRVLPCT